MERALLIAAAIVLAPAGAWAAAPSAWLAGITAGMQRVHGRFTDLDHGYSVAGPSNAPMYFHAGLSSKRGILIVLGERRIIVVYSEYADLDSEYGQPFAVWRKSRGGVHGTGRIGDRPACLVTFNHGAAVCRIMQRRGTGKASGILYTFRLATTRSGLPSDRAALAHVAASFRRVPIVP